MKLSLNWLKQYVNINTDVADLAHNLTMAGLEVNEVITIGDWRECYVGLVTSVEKHPNADRLSLCSVEINSERFQVVCGAPNVEAGIKICLARPGARLYNPRSNSYEKLKANKIRGVTSEGMICSELELGIGEDHNGILILPAETAVGTNIESILSDMILDVELTPNRVDCYSVTGIAREISALTGQTLCLPNLDFPSGNTDVPLSINIEAPDLCPRYTGAIIKNVTIKESPDWLKDRLAKSGLNPINNIVDITNFVMYELNQPMHAFDLNTIPNGIIKVRRAVKDEPLTLLDGQSLKLDSDTLVIADDTKPIALAGIMGGQNTQITSSTTDILLEAATFDGFNNRMSSDKYRVKTDASLRFEKSLSEELPIKGLNRAISLITDMLDTSTLAAYLDIDTNPEREPLKVILDTEKIQSVLGMKLNLNTCTEVLQSLGFECSNVTNNQLTCTIPYWRNDVTLPEDLIEEIIRIIGYDEVPTRMLTTEIPHHKTDNQYTLKESVRDLFVASGLQEIISYPLTDATSLAKLELSDILPNSINVLNPMSGLYTQLRTSLRQNLLATLQQNQYNHEGPFKLFELGRVFYPSDNGLPEEIETITGVCAGKKRESHWSDGSENISFYDTKGIIEQLFSHLNMDVTYVINADGTYIPTQSASIFYNDNVIGTIGAVKKSVLQNFDIHFETVFMFDINFNKIIESKTSTANKFVQISRFPEAIRDLALVVDQRIASDDITKQILTQKYVTSVEIFDVYVGEEVEPNKKSLGFRIHMQSMDDTLTNELIIEQIDKIMRLVSNKFNAQLR
tara:strand:- start:161 stop:2554 length:2394 start_codon:yes stop_codon:yes gene_type:complete